MRLQKKVWIPLLIIGIALVIFAVLNLSSKDNTVDEQINIVTTEVQKGNISTIVKGSGAVVATLSKSVFVMDQGTLAEVHVEENALVNKGQTLMTYKAVNVESSLRQQNNALKANQNMLIDKQEYYKKLVIEGASQSEVDTAKSAIERAKNDVAATEAEIAALKRDQKPPAPLVAPIDGTITKVSVAAGGAVINGSEAFHITDYKNLSTTIQIDELDISKIKLGMDAEVKLDALANRVFAGKVETIANEGKVTNGVSLFDVTIRLTEPTDVKAGMSAQGSIIIEEKKDILILPIEAVTQKDDKYFVKVLNNVASTSSPDGASESAINEKEVTVGIHDDSLIEITKGLTIGEKIVIPTVIDTNSAAPAGFGMFGGGMEGDMDEDPSSGGENYGQ